MKRLYYQRVKNPYFRKMYPKRTSEMTPEQRNKRIAISDLQMIADMLKNLSLAGFVAMFIGDKYSFLIIVVAFTVALLTFPIRRDIIDKEDELNKLQKKIRF